MKVSMAEFYLKVLQVYDDKQVPGKVMRQALNMVFRELSQTNPEDLSKEHSILMENVIPRFAEHEEFEKAALIKEAHAATLKVFEARDEHLKKLRELEKENKDDTETDKEA